jgi:hypothetical protein
MFLAPMREKLYLEVWLTDIVDNVPGSNEEETLPGGLVD